MRRRRRPSPNRRSIGPHISRAPTTASATTARSGRYIRRSAPTSVAIGTMLDVGASVTKNQTPRKPSAGHRFIATTVAIRSSADEQRVRPHVAERQRQRPSIEHHQRPRPDRQMQVVSDHHRLVQQVGPRRRSGRKPTDRRARSRPVQGRQHDPRRRQTQVQPLPRPQRLPHRVEHDTPGRRPRPATAR